jgi:hypothetical protein
VILVGIGDHQRRRLDGGEPDLASVAEHEAFAVDDAGDFPGCDGCAGACGRNGLRGGVMRRERSKACNRTQ